MQHKFLFPNKYKNVGLLLFFPSAIIGLFALVNDYQPNWLDFNVPTLFIDKNIKELFGFTDNNILNEILAVLIIISSLLVSFSKEKIEDEYISKLRLESLVWAVYINYGILLFAFIFIHDISFLWIMIFNMFTVLLFFMVRFNWLIFKIKKSAYYEE